MPIYQYACECCENTESRYSSVANRNEPQLCQCGGLMNKQLSAPMVHTDLPGYQSPVTGKWVEGRKARQEDLARSGCRPWEGMEQERKESDRKKAYAEEAQDKRLTEIAGQALAELPPEKKRILGC